MHNSQSLKPSFSIVGGKADVSYQSLFIAILTSQKAYALLQFVLYLYAKTCSHVAAG